MSCATLLVKRDLFIAQLERDFKELTTNQAGPMVSSFLRGACFFSSDTLAEVDMNSLDVGVASEKNAQGSDPIDSGVKTIPTCPTHTGRTRVQFPIVCSLQTVHSNLPRARS